MPTQRGGGEGAVRPNPCSRERFQERCSGLQRVQRGCGIPRSRGDANTPRLPGGGDPARAVRRSKTIQVASPSCLRIQRRAPGKLTVGLQMRRNAQLTYVPDDLGNAAIASVITILATITIASLLGRLCFRARSPSDGIPAPL